MQNTVANKSITGLIMEKLTSPAGVGIMIIFFIALIYGQTLYFGFTYLDDKLIILQNILSQKQIFNIKEAFSRDAFFSTDGLAFYRPLQNVSFMFDAVISGKNAYFYHLSNLLFHAFTSFSVFYLFKLLKYDEKLAALVTMIFTVHPIFTHAVAWIPSRGDLMVALFGILSFIMFIKFLNDKKTLYLVLNIILFFLAMFSKETAVLFPVVYAAYWIFFVKKRKLNGKLIAMLVSYALIILLFVGARSKVVIEHPGDNSFSFASFIKNLPTLPEILAKSIIPVNLSTMPKFTTLVTTLGVILIIAIIVLLIFGKNNNIKMILFGAGWYLLFAVPAMAYRHNYADWGYDYFEHRSYLPEIGIIILLIEIYKSYKLSIKKEYLFYASAVVILFFSGYTFMNAKYYDNIFSFYGRATTVSDKNALANYNLGNYFKEKQNAQLAKYHLLKAIRINEGYLEAYQNLSDVYNYLGKTDSAITLLRTALSINAYYYQAWKFLGVIYTNKGQNREALSILQQGLRLKQNDPEIYMAIGVAYMNLSIRDSAEIFLKQALALKPDYPAASNMLSQLYKSSGNLSKSTEILEKNSAKDPKAVDNYITLGELYGRQGQYEKALDVLKKALALDPKNHKTYNNIGTLFAIQRKFPQAMEAFKNAVKYDPKNPSYLLNLGLAYNDMKDRKKAIETIKNAASLGSMPARQWLNDNKIK